jgi:pyrroline-5-carboxylate reductase
MQRVAIIGMGTMGSAIQERMADTFDVVGIGHDDSLEVVVKPQSFAELSEELRLHIDKQLVLSVMAGISIRSLSDSLGTARVVRTMPNIGLPSGCSHTGWYMQNTSDTEAVNTILDLWGSSERLDNEDQLHGFTALAGSSPGYYSTLMHWLERAGVVEGLSEEQSRRAIIGGFLGLASVLTSDTVPADIVGRVASKGGTTEAALVVFEQSGLDSIVCNAVDAAAKRSRELSDLV